ncbi:hypothetical protein H0E87_003037 [Populus deltoides]|uniref:RRM domain-containing protein n=1 Tax=Populus deltoides TaxID=3696 RepID=A0A8T2ZXE9_POPDE|nr:hypothetical protein H0E87_003037 [Populus deltoides]
MDPDRIESRSLFVKNLNLKTADEILKKHFGEHMKEGRIQSVRGTVLDGHAHILQLCHAQKDEHAVKKAGKDKSSTKLLVRNVAFEATEKDLTQLFSPFGQVLERAKEGESLEELRARSLARLAAQFTDEQNGFQNPA